MVSAVFRGGGDVAFVAEELKAIFDPRSGQWLEGKYVPSLIAAFGGLLERHMIGIGFLVVSEQLVHEDRGAAGQCPLSADLACSARTAVN